MSFFATAAATAGVVTTVRNRKSIIVKFMHMLEMPTEPSAMGPSRPTIAVVKRVMRKLCSMLQPMPTCVHCSKQRVEGKRDHSREKQPPDLLIQALCWLLAGAHLVALFVLLTLLALIRLQFVIVNPSHGAVGFVIDDGRQHMLWCVLSGCVADQRFLINCISGSLQHMLLEASRRQASEVCMCWSPDGLVDTRACTPRRASDGLPVTTLPCMRHMVHMWRLCVDHPKGCCVSDDQENCVGFDVLHCQLGHQSSIIIVHNLTVHNFSL